MKQSAEHVLLMADFHAGQRARHHRLFVLQGSSVGHSFEQLRFSQAS